MGGDRGWKASDAVTLLDLAHKRAVWVARLTNVIRFDGAATVDRATIVEMWDNGFAPTLPTRQQRTPVPLGGLTRQPALHVSVTHEGDPIPILLRSEEREMIATSLASEAMRSYQALRYATDHHLDDDEAERDIRDEVRWLIEPKLESRPAFLDHRPSMVEAIPDLSSLCAIYRDTRLVVALPDEESVQDGHLCLVERHSEKVPVERATLYRAIAVRWRHDDPKRSTRARWMAGASDARQRHLVVVDGSAMEPEHWVSDDAVRHHDQTWRWPFWLPDTYVAEIGVASFLECHSYHVQVTVPSGCYIHQAQLRLLNADDEKQADRASEMIIVHDDDHHLDRAHLHFTKGLSHRGAEIDTYYPTSQLRLILRPSYHNGLRAGMYLSGLATALLWFLAFTVGWRNPGWGTGPQAVPLGNPNGESLVALLLLGPTLGLAFVARQDEHLLTKRIHARYRFRLLSAAIAVFTSATAIALGLHGKELFTVLAGCAGYASIMTIFTATSGLYSLRQIKHIEDLTMAAGVSSTDVDDRRASSTSMPASGHPGADPIRRRPGPGP